MKVKGDLKELKEQLVNGERGLISTNCRSFRGKIENLTYGMCYGFAATIYQTAIVMIVTSFMALISTITIFCLVKKFSASGLSGLKVDSQYQS